MVRKHFYAVSVAVAAVGMAAVGMVAVTGGPAKQVLLTPAPPAGGFGSGAADTLITGTVTCDGKALPTGAVFFVGSKGLAGQGVVGGDGKYQAGLVPEGTVKVVYSARPLTERQLQIQLGNPDPGPAGDWVDQPPPPPDVRAKAAAVEARYGPSKPGLSYTVVRGPQTFDVAFTTTK